MRKIFALIIILIFSLKVFASESANTLIDKYNTQKDYFDYSVVLTEFPKSYYYTTIKINKSKCHI